MKNCNKKIILDAKEKKYAIAQININNLEWAKSVLQTAQELKSPIILGFTENSINYMGGFKCVYNLIKEMVIFYNITIPIILHLDHGTFDSVFKAIDVGFNSVMFAGSNYNLEENLKKTQKIVKYANLKGVLVESEIGNIGDEEEQNFNLQNNNNSLADPFACKLMSDLGVDMLSVGINNSHGIYSSEWEGINFQLLNKIKKETSSISLVLHGGSGISEEMLKKSIELGIVKINFNTEFQISFAKAIRKYIEAKKDLNILEKGFDPRKLLFPGCLAIKELMRKKLYTLGSINRY
ncbi:class II fructose-bisphosphate aldolase [Candidatus Phytoplasma palmae]|uniref:class II fructose-bisphosphate aldolase n=1 Tax=Candidatus Phytoplasma palmae TaxID=85624 RepID=UPI003990782B